MVYIYFSNKHYYSSKRKHLAVLSCSSMFCMIPGSQNNIRNQQLDAFLKYFCDVISMGPPHSFEVAVKTVFQNTFVHFKDIRILALQPVPLTAEPPKETAGFFGDSAPLFN